ncbi:hypothetical protein VIGAN_03225200 [Vigna angularis var. angularis]|uniref:Uncharacterized protein n=1 Tax=Vigna angularis var. angularis TaxID=157739 RepID=A0A0S3RNT9_PHAAN|nr:hypothetical protein VIGAN_03225200 [Vigna angularis var. angularis]
MDCGVEILTLKLRFEATSALCRWFMAGTRTGATFGTKVRTSLPTDIAVMLVNGMYAATFLLIQAAATDADSPMPSISSSVTPTITSMPVFESACSMCSLASYRRTCVI